VLQEGNLNCVTEWLLELCYRKVTWTVLPVSWRQNMS